MLFKKNIQFSRLIKAGGSLKEFNFRKPSSPDGQLYHVDVSDDRGHRVYFNLVLETEEWIIQGSLLPAWITEAEGLISEAVRAEERTFEPHG
jgi:hypothetical protein